MRLGRLRPGTRALFVIDVWTQWMRFKIDLDARECQLYPSVT